MSELSIVEKTFYATSRNKKSNFHYFNLAETSTWQSLVELLKQGYFSSAILLAGITTNGQCSQNKKLAEKVNVTHTCLLLSLFNKHNLFSVFISSSQVFDHKTAFIPWQAEHSPTTLYGIQKSLVENHIQEHKLDCAVLRVSKVIGDKFPLFEQILQHARARKSIALFDDYCAAPVSCSLVCQNIITILSQKIAGGYQCSGKEDISYAEMAKRLFAHLSISGNIVPTSAKTKNLSPVKYGSLKAYSSASFTLKNQTFEQLLMQIYPVDAFVKNKG